MTKSISNIPSFFVPIMVSPDIGEEVSNEVFRNLLNGRNYALIGTQILFEHDHQFYLTMIDNEQQSYSLADYAMLPENAPYELINGKLEFMASPYDLHQLTLANLHLLVHSFVKKEKIGTVRFAPLDVHFDDKNVFQPDLMFISNERKDIIKKFIHGVPDLIVEVLSSNKKHDLGKKKEVYGEHNVLEYWAIDYEQKTLDLYINEERVMIFKQQFQEKDTVQSLILKDFSFVLGEIFEE
ncbi:MAG: Uma2 family endonuclease [Bacteroidota bacterium]